MSQSRLNEFVRAELSHFAQRVPKTLSLQTILHASTPGKVANLVRAELPYRFAARIKHIESHEGWEQQPVLVQLRDIFSDSFRELRLAEVPASGVPGHEPTVLELEQFTEVISNLRRRHGPVVALLAEAMRKMQKEDGCERYSDSSYQSWVDKFLSSRISTEMLTSHYVAVMKTYSDKAPTLVSHAGNVGIVDTKCNPGKICELAAAQVQESLGAGVRIQVQTNNCSSSQETIEMSYIPKYLFFIVQELLRNSARATLEAVEEASNKEAELAKRPIVVTVCADKKQVAIRISDQGGGVSFGNTQNIWSYVFSTSRQPYEDYIVGASPLSGWGMGLPLGRLYAEYLGGSLELMNMPGTGVDAYLFLNRIDPEEYAAASNESSSSYGSIASISEVV